MRNLDRAAKRETAVCIDVPMLLFTLRFTCSASPLRQLKSEPPRMLEAAPRRFRKVDLGDKDKSHSCLAW
jgi:hypothetical protein